MKFYQYEGNAGGSLHPQTFGLRANITLAHHYNRLTTARQSVISIAVLLLALLVGVFGVAAQEAEPIVVTGADGAEVVISDTSRVITIGGSVTEIAFALGASENIVARDDSSLYPPQVNDLPSVGYVRRLSAEPVLALDPTLIITTEDAGPPEAVEQLRAAGVTILIVPGEDTVEGIITNVGVIATALSVEEAGASLAAQISADFAEAQALVATVETAPRVMFIYARGAGAVSVAGANSSADTMIALAGGENAVTEYEGYQPITAEAVVASAPDVILLMTAGLESIGGVDGLLEQPGIAQTPAGENRRIVAMEDLYLLGFSTRIGTAVEDLAYLIHEELDPPILTLLRADGRFNTLLRGIGIAGQEALLSGDTAYTLFAPTDEAFAATFPPEVLEGFFGSTISVQATLSYHILEGAVTLEDLTAQDGEAIQTLYPNGTIPVAVTDEGVTLNETVHILEADKVAGNGIIHIIDGILIPARR